MASILNSVEYSVLCNRASLDAKVDAQEDRIRQLLRDTKMLDKHAMEKVLPPWRFVLDNHVYTRLRESLSHSRLI